MSDLAVRILDRFVKASGFEGRVHWPPARSEVNSARERLIAAGHSASAVDAAITLMRSGRGDLLQRVLAGELDVEDAWRIRGRR